MKRTWTVEAEEGREAVREALVECELIGERLGGAFIVVPVRAEHEFADGSRTFETVRWQFVWDSFVPAARALAERPEVYDGPGDLEPVPVPDDEGDSAAA